MKTSQILVGQEYAQQSSKYYRVQRVTVLAHGWRKKTSSYSSRKAEPTYLTVDGVTHEVPGHYAEGRAYAGAPAANGVLVILHGDPEGYSEYLRRDEIKVVNLASIKYTWADWQIVEAERKAMEATVAAAKAIESGQRATAFTVRSGALEALGLGELVAREQPKGRVLLSEAQYDALVALAQKAQVTA